jgi:DGQHR domain-containing protein
MSDVATLTDQLRSTFTSDHLQLAATIGAGPGTPSEKISQLFSTLPDPLLSANDVSQLLGQLDATEVAKTLSELCDQGTLEQSNTTTRPLDAEELALYRLANTPFTRLKLLALEVHVAQEGQTRLQFSCDGRLVRSLAVVDRLDAVAGKGQQREEIRAHVGQIAKGISSGTQIPNSILLVLRDTQVAYDNDNGESPPESFVVIRPLSPTWTEMSLPTDPSVIVERVRLVELDFPYRRAAFDDEKSCVLVDGQQRTAALSMVDIDRVPLFQLSVNALVGSDEEAKRVFQIANSTVKISTQFSRALMASMSDVPGYLHKERARAVATRTLALTDPKSPFFGRIQYPGSKQKVDRPMAYNSLFQVVSIFADSGLPLETDSALATVVGRAFAQVRDTWPKAWNSKPAESKLVHGVGLRAVASLVAGKLETFVVNASLEEESVWEQLTASLQRLRSRIVWTDADMVEASTAVKKVYREQIANRQNTNQDIGALTTFLKKESLSLDSKASKGGE